MIPALVDSNRIRAAHTHDTTLTPTFRRLNIALTSVRLVVTGKACWTREGARYFGIEWEAPVGTKRRQRTRRRTSDAVELVAGS